MNIDELWKKWSLPLMAFNPKAKRVMSKKQFIQAIAEIISSPVKPGLMQKIAEEELKAIYKGIENAYWLMYYNDGRSLPANEKQIFDIIEPLHTILEKYNGVRSLPAPKVSGRIASSLASEARYEQFSANPILLASGASQENSVALKMPPRHK